MAYHLITDGNQVNRATKLFICDTDADVPNIPKNSFNLGSICIALNEGTVKTYMADSSQEWYEV